MLSIKGKYDEAGERVEEAVRVVQARLNNDSVANDKDQDLYARAINIRAAVLQAQVGITTTLLLRI